MLELRPATVADSESLFAWRNDPVTMACSKSTAPVSREDHDRWMKFSVAQGYPEHIVLMADDGPASVGVVRFDSSRRDEMVYHASITVAPQHRGRGYSALMLALACSYMPEYAIRAEIRANNTVSRKTFERCGFHEVGADQGFITYERGPLT
jgi:RimJ/RimL family protein N-acetyltransferase